MHDPVLGFYDQHAATYAADSVTNPHLLSFLQRCRSGGRVLELGTGAGLDAKVMLDAGFDVDASDGSVELAKIASARLGQPVRTMTFNELDAVEAYDGIYACASLTHARRNELPSILAKIRAALVDGGVVWASFKTGAQEDEDSLGRYYNYLSPSELLTCWQDNGPWTRVEIESWVGSGYDQQVTNWSAITAYR